MDPWDQFADNLATDLAPFISLFGERLTKQFLSESVSLLDNFIFALAPLGILTTLVSVIRVCGSSSLRAFIGRAQEGPGEAESELLSCVSETTGELFNDTGISRIFGRPRILEVVVWEEEDPQNKQSYWKIGTLRDALQHGAWVPGRGSWILDEKGCLPELDIPNLSLNKGIKRRSPLWFYCAAAFGLVLQVGVITLFQKNGRPVDSYAFPLFLFGTLLLCTGMFFCAFIIERSSSECYLHAKRPSKLYWLQPGRQHVGDQVFDAFLGSVRSPAVTVVGFVAQFVGLRGLHATVILAQLGATLLMAIIRTCLRTKRIGPEQNRIDGQERQLLSHKSQELDSFAFHLENAKTPSSSYQSSLLSSSATTEVSVQPVGNATRLIQTRTRLAELTSVNDRNPSAAWDDLPIRQIARSLADAIEQTIDLLSVWKNVRDDYFAFDLSLLCQSQHKSIAPILETYTIALERADDTLRWRVNENELEAIIGLWTWSLLKSDQKWLQEGLGRIVGLTDSEARAPDTDLYFHKWIFRQTEARMVSSRMVSCAQQLFGYYSDEYPNDKEILVVRTKNKVEKMVAQDIYIHFLRSALEGLPGLGGEINILPGSHNRLVAHNSRIDDLVECFESSGLGSREDALLCIVPSLRNRGLLPELAADSHPIRLRLEELIGSNKWPEALSVAYWLCERSAGDEFEHSANELGYICLRAMADNDSNVQTVGYKYAMSAIETEPRSFLLNNTRNPRPEGWLDTSEQAEFWTNYTRQLGWLAWHIADKSSNRLHIRRSLEAYGVHGSSIPASNVNGCESLGQQGQQILLQWLATSNGRQLPEDSDQLALDWVCQNGHHALLNWLVDRCVELSERSPSFPFRFILWTAERKYRLALALLQRRGVSLDMQEPSCGMVPIVHAITERKYNAVPELLEAGADVDARGSMTETPLLLASHLGDARTVALLLQHGAQVNAQDRTGLSPLIACAAAGHVEVAQTLLDHGADIDLTNYDGCSALISAVAEEQIEMMRLLLSRGADINSQSNSGHTALILTAENRYTTAMEILLTYGADEVFLGRNSLPGGNVG
ncbi:hypothetical protein BJX96DRAFT_164826 [Aspergillus floccosus]